MLLATESPIALNWNIIRRVNAPTFYKAADSLSLMYVRTRKIKKFFIHI